MFQLHMDFWDFCWYYLGSSGFGQTHPDSSVPLGQKISVPATFFNKSFQVLGIFHIPGSLFTFLASHTACLGNSFREFNPGTSFLASAVSWNFSASLCEPPFLCLSRLQKLVLHEWCHVILSQPRGLYYFMAELR